MKKFESEPEKSEVGNGPDHRSVKIWCNYSVCTSAVLV